MALDTVEKLTPAQAARQLGISAIRVRQLADEGQLRCQRTPLGRLFDVADVERLAEQRALARVGADGHGDGPRAA